MGIEKKSKKKPNKSTRPDAVATKAKAQKTDNPFELIWSRRKFDVLGKKSKGEERRIGQSRSRGVDKRKNTLEKEYEQSCKSSVFVDGRIREDDDGIGEIDKGIIHSQRQRQRHKRKNEIMEKINMKSNLCKMEKAKHKAEKKKVLAEVDREFYALDPELLGTLYRPSHIPENQDKSYALLMDVMSLGRRGGPTERTKTPEEIAQEEQQKLEELEQTVRIGCEKLRI